MSKTSLAISSNIVDDLILGTLFDVDDIDEEKQGLSSSRSISRRSQKFERRRIFSSRCQLRCGYQKCVATYVCAESFGVRSILLTM
ncbi:unnamed protein product [Albugo candida]|uniref:Uncharacterized protein n=1 Tax=Albugo candida TaxID=65357 RepID=A0A024GT68_9STRA|nr:unnamed protein product [Albugo candida]|eukprot:CCI49546.1 unnamed protein product [Albugo candida]